MSLSKEKMFRADTSGISRSILIFKDFKIDELRWLRRLVLCYAARYAGFISTFYTAPHPRYFLLMISYMESNSFFFLRRIPFRLPQAVSMPAHKHSALFPSPSRSPQSSCARLLLPHTSSSLLLQLGGVVARPTLSASKNSVMTNVCCRVP